MAWLNETLEPLKGEEILSKKYPDSLEPCALRLKPLRKQPMIHRTDLIGNGFLKLIQFIVYPFERHEIFMGTLLSNFSVVHDKNAVCMPNR